MTTEKVRLEWRKGINGDQGTYVFSPNPTLRRVPSALRTAVHTPPLLDGVIVQNLANTERYIDVSGVLYSRYSSWDAIETARNTLISFVASGPGQLHIISALRHIRYDGQIIEGLQFAEQARSNFQDYSFRMLVPSGVELTVTEPEHNLTSDTVVI